MKGKYLFIATSGGIDSMVLVHLFQNLDYNFGMLHCNFNLRGKESDGDMKFVQDYGDKYLIPWSVGHFDTKGYAKENKVSIQVAAREMRYDWFLEQLEEKQFDYVLTAHHLDDNLETFIINLSRGTGLDGLTGIPAINDKILRPLLPFSREEIEIYAKENSLKWREDSSNESDKYLRNKIRHHIVPILKEINPNFLDSFQKTQNYLSQSQSIVKDGEYIIFNEVASEKVDGTIQFDLKKLLQMPNYQAYLYQFLHQFGFTAWNDIYDLVHAQSGKQVFSEKFTLLKNRYFLILYPTENVNKNEYYLIEKNQKDVKVPLNLAFCNVSDISNPNSNCIFVDEELLQFPLVIRKWNEGDSFYPLGMKGKKKVSKYFKDEKLSLIDKSNQWILCSDNQIVWIIGKRQDERFKITTNTTRILQITLQ
ncbi:tRNA lysidine(34) synthetase TilS [Flavobacterium sp. SUN052]|uniref:tRNA lysidine(34) synthetase TilS n=1 Tax=Flavobacterium sp. SUN052 TaxID=3002441 RepID=UPI002DB65728|nr:tRNA lysidine(34) synthetase TilS [Flavobacterium sp. SUN052]